MKHTLDNSHPVYIQISIFGVLDKPGLLSAMANLFQHPDYMNKDSLWNFTHATMGLSLGDLGEIVGVLGLFKTKKKNFANKVALLVPNLMELGMAKMFVSISKLLPFTYKVFKAKEDAIAFLLNDKALNS